MSKEHLTPVGWKPCGAKVRPCRYPTREMGAAVSPVIIDEAVKDVQAGKPNAVKKFFNSLFGKTKKEPELAPAESSSFEKTAILEQQKSVDKIPPPIPKVSVNIINGAVKKGDHGQWEVGCTSRFNEFFIHRFGDLVTDKATAEQLHNADLLKDYQLGECGVIASELWHRNEHVEGYYVFRSEEDDEHMEGYGLHDFVRLHDGTYVDSLGLWSEKALLASWRKHDPKGRIVSVEDEASVEKDKNVRFSNPELFGVLERLIDQHVNSR